jgi:uncharacterized protein (TIGR03000 family)
MPRQRIWTLGATFVLSALCFASTAEAQRPESGAPSGYTAGGPYSFRPLDPTWYYRVQPPPPPRYERLGDSGVFMSSLNYPGVYGAYTYGVTPTTYYDQAPFMNPDVAPPGFTTLTARPRTSAELVANPRTARIDVLVPNTEAELTFDNTRLTVPGTRREFITPPLVPGGKYVYNVRVTWMDDGVLRPRDKNVFVEAGDRMVVDLSTGRGNFEGPSMRVLPMPESGSTLRTQPLR